MRTRANRRMAAIGVLAACCFGGLAAAVDGSKTPIGLVPSRVKEAFQRESGGATITEVEASKMDGVPVYEAQGSAGGTSHEATVTAEGALVEIEETVSFEKIPGAVKSAILTSFGMNASVVVERKMIVVYEAEGKIAGKHAELIIMPTGRVHNDGNDDSDSDDGDSDDDDTDDEE